MATKPGKCSSADPIVITRRMVDAINAFSLTQTRGRVRLMEDVDIGRKFIADKDGVDISQMCSLGNRGSIAGINLHKHFHVWPQKLSRYSSVEGGLVTWTCWIQRDYDGPADASSDRFMEACPAEFNKKSVSIDRRILAIAIGALFGIQAVDFKLSNGDVEEALKLRSEMELLCIG